MLSLRKTNQFAGVHFASRIAQYGIHRVFLFNENRFIWSGKRIMTMQDVTLILAWIVIFLVTVTVHEVAHGVVAYLRGDQTAKAMGRLTLNPLRHIDLFWTILLPVVLLVSTGGRFMIGMAKPVPVNFSNLHRPKLDMILVALAGPLANIIFAGFLASLIRMTHNPLLLLGVYFNLGLAVFNLIPIPPLDGSRILAGILPRPLDRQYLRLEPYGFWIVLILYFTGLLYTWVIPGINLLTAFLGVPRLNL